MKEFDRQNMYTRNHLSKIEFMRLPIPTRDQEWAMFLEEEGAYKTFPVLITPERYVPSQEAYRAAHIKKGAQEYWLKEELRAEEEKIEHEHLELFERPWAEIEAQEDEQFEIDMQNLRRRTREEASYLGASDNYEEDHENPWVRTFVADDDDEALNYGASSVFDDDSDDADDFLFDLWMWSEADRDGYDDESY